MITSEPEDLSAPLKFAHRVLINNRMMSI